MTRRSRTEVELRALLDLAGQLTAMRDVDALLQEIVTQARRLLGVDIAYLALVQPDGSLLIGVTAGAAGLLGAQLSPKAGIAGLVASSGTSFRTPDYLEEPAITHEAAIDRIAAGERIRAIAGVPLRAGDRILGVLFAAERSRRDFGDDEVSLLASLAAHAAVAIENARLFEEVRQQQEATERAVALHERLGQVVLRGGSVDDVLRALADVVPGEMTLVTGAAMPPAGPGHHTKIPVTAGDERLGTLVAVTDEAMTAATLRLLERSALTIALVLLSARTIAEAEARTRRELLAALVEGVSTPAVEAQARAAGVAMGEPVYVAVVAPGDGTKVGALQRGDALGLGAALADEHDGAVVALVPAPASAGDGGGELVGAIRRRAADAPPATVVVAGPAVGARAIAEAHADARRALGLLRGLGREGTVTTVEELGPYRYLFSQAGRTDAARFVARVIGPLLDLPEARGEELLRTLEGYLAHAQQHSATAAALGIHNNTLYQRLERIGRVLGEGWRDRALDVQLAIALHRLARQLGGAP